MTTTDVSRVATDGGARLNLVRCALTGALVFGIFYALCWFGAVAGGLGPHGYLSLFTTEPITSTIGLAAGGLCSLAVGLVVGGLIAIVYNAFAFLERR
jgi:hypothetical protein